MNARSIVGLVAFALSMAATQTAFASHFRYGTIQWRIPDPAGAPRVVEFTVTTGWRSDAIGTETLQFGDSTSQTMNFGAGTNLGTGTDQAGETYAVRQLVFTHTYAADGQYTAFFESCCRVSSLSGGSANGNYRVESSVAVGNGNTGGPTTGALPIVQVQRGAIESFGFNMFDPDGDPVTCRFATAAETGIGDPIPTVASQDPTITSNSGAACTFSWNLTGATMADDGDKYVMHVVLESVRGGATSKAAVDFIVEIIAPTVPVPSCTADASLNIIPGTTGTHTMTIGGTGALTLGAVGLPTGATLNPGVGSSVTNGQMVTFSWTPTLMQTGSRTILVNVTNASNITRSCEIAVQVPICSDFGQACTVGLGTCAATGILVCTGIGTSGCSAMPGSPGVELCDGLDNDCDGTPDNGFNVGTMCSGGSGVCASTLGVVECTAGGGARCSVDPGGSTDASSMEVCDGLDNDCDGTPDEGFNVGTSCMGTGGVCASTSGVVECTMAGGTQCSVDPGGSADASSMEVCDGLDNDCDGTPDEGFAVGTSCTGVLGVCASISGVIECTAGGGAQCSVDPGGSADGSSMEVCDGLDNDCDGTSDDGFAVGTTCMGTAGVCASTSGVIECTLVGGAQCSVDPGGSADASSGEACDGLDNDCDGTPDEGFNVGASCSGTDGVCASASGVIECTLVGGAQCSVDPGGSADASSMEVCDGNDNDCDGTPDEGFNVGAGCSGGAGVCALASGSIECDGTGGAQCSVDPGGSNDASAAETCDGSDNDCNGATDEGILCECLQDSDCDDANACTVNTCVADACVDTAIAVGDVGACAGGLVCSGAPTNLCVACADTDPTSTDSGCDMTTPHCVVGGAGAVCEVCADGGPGLDLGCAMDAPNCVRGAGGANTCVACVNDTDCDDGNECTSESCSAGMCANPQLAEFTACSVGVCTAATMCVGVAVTIDGPMDGETVGTSTPTITGTGTPGGTVTITVDGDVLGTALVDPFGAWFLVLSTPLVDGLHAVSADLSAGSATAGATSMFLTDTATVVTIDSPADQSVTMDSSPLIQGTGEPGATITVFIDGAEVGTTTVGGDGSWTFVTPTPLLNGAHSVSVTATDALGNTDSDSSDFSVEANTLVLITGPTNGARLANPQPTITGTALPGASVDVSVEIDGVTIVVGTVTADGAGFWSIVPGSPLVDGDYIVHATATDPIGNMAEDASTFSIDTETTVSITGADPSTGVVSGTGEPGATISVRVDGVEVGTAVVGTDGTWVFQGSPLSPGVHDVSVVATDEVGNTATAETTVSVGTLDGGVVPDGGFTTSGGVSGGAMCTTGVGSGGSDAAGLFLVVLGLAMARRRRR